MQEREVTITWYGEADNCWVASCKTKPGLMAHGDTELNALRQFLIVEKLWDKSAEDFYLRTKQCKESEVKP